MKPLPDNILRRMSPQDRKPMGKAGMTSDEALTKAIARSERDLQGQISNWLNLKGIWFYNARMDKKTTAKVGTPDFLLCFTEMVGSTEFRRPTALEVKFGNGRLSIEQEQTKRRMEANGWRYHVVRSLIEVIEIVRL